LGASSSNCRFAARSTSTRARETITRRDFCLLCDTPRRETRHGDDLGQSAEAGNYKYICGFPHLVTDVGDERFATGSTQKSTSPESMLIWKDAPPAHLIDVAVSCDSDDTHRQHQLFCLCAA